MATRATLHLTPCGKLGIKTQLQSCISLLLCDASYVLMLTPPATNRSARSAGQTLSQPSLSSNSSNPTIYYINRTAFPGCLSCPNLRSILVRDPVLPQDSLSNPTNPHRENCPAVFPWSRGGKGCEVWRLCHTLTSPLHDTRQLLACCFEVHVNWRQQDPR